MAQNLRLDSAYKRSRGQQAQIDTPDYVLRFNTLLITEPRQIITKPKRLLHPTSERASGQ